MDLRMSHATVALAGRSGPLTSQCMHVLWIHGKQAVNQGLVQPGLGLCLSHYSGAHFSMGVGLPKGVALQSTELGLDGQHYFARIEVRTKQQFLMGDLPTFNLSSAFNHSFSNGCRQWLSMARLQL